MRTIVSFSLKRYVSPFSESVLQALLDDYTFPQFGYSTVRRKFSMKQYHYDMQQVKISAASGTASFPTRTRTAT